MTDEIDQLRATVRAAAVDLGGASLCRSLSESGPGWDERSWKVFAADIGLGCLGLPEHVGGMGGMEELTVVAEELGRSLLPVPFLSTVFTGRILSRIGGPADAVLEELAAGEPAAFVGLQADGWFSPDSTAVRASDDRGSWTLTGTVDYVVGAAGARWIVAAARTGDGTDLFLIDGTAPELHVSRTATIDLSRAQASVVLHGTPATRLTEGGTAASVVLPALDEICIVLAAEQLGGMRWCLDATVGYVKERHQFGRAIGSFQAVKHTLADLLVLVEASHSAVVRAVESPDPSEASATARAWCSDAYRTVSAEAVQLHGGIGFTWEHDCHLYFRRARADAQLFGSASVHRERVAVALAW